VLLIIQKQIRMNLSEVKSALALVSEVRFELPNGTMIPEHFHVTEVGAITRHFIDCGGTERMEKKVNFQLWVAGDTDHRLASEKLTRIIELAENRLGLGNLEVEVEYQGETIGKYALDFSGKHFLLINQQTACLAQDKCGIPAEKQQVSLATLGKTDASACCTPGGGCC
jgi:Family of unknown function (DUF6428)